MGSDGWAAAAGSAKGQLALVMPLSRCLNPNALLLLLPAAALPAAAHSGAAGVQGGLRPGAATGQVDAAAARHGWARGQALWGLVHRRVCHAVHVALCARLKRRIEKQNILPVACSPVGQGRQKLANRISECAWLQTCCVPGSTFGPGLAF